MNGTVANNRRSAPRGSSTSCDGTLNTIVSRRGNVYGLQLGIDGVLGLPVRANAMNTYAICADIFCALSSVPVIEPCASSVPNTRGMSRVCGAPHFPPSLGDFQSS